MNKKIFSVVKLSQGVYLLNKIVKVSNLNIIEGEPTADIEFNEKEISEIDAQYLVAEFIAEAM